MAKKSSAVGWAGRRAFGRWRVFCLVGLVTWITCGRAEVSMLMHVGASGTLRLGGRPYEGVGVNYFDCFLRTLKDGKDTSYEAGFAALAAKGIPFARFCATGFWPIDMALYRQDRTEYFRRLDGVVRAAEQHGVGLVPSLFWFFPTVPDLVGEPMDQWGNPGSETHRWMRQYVTEIVQRYRGSRAIWVWEFGNEFHLGADLPNGAAHRPKVVPQLGTAGARTERDDVRHEHVRRAFAEFAEEVRRHDPLRPVTTGDSFLRPSAWHLQAERSWSKDQEEQFAEMLAKVNPRPVNLISVHAYGEEAWDRMDWLRRAAATLGRPVFIGEFGVKGEPGTEQKQQREFQARLDVLRSADFPLAALWVYDYAKQPEWSVSAVNARSWQLEAIAAHNRALAAGSR